MLFSICLEYLHNSVINKKEGEKNMLEKINSKKGYNIITIIILIITIIFMFYWIGKKEGFHEDEIFSYG